MNVALLSREFRDGEAISEYCKSIAEYLVDNGHEADIVAFDDGSYYSIDDRVNVKRVPLNFEGDNLYNWAMMLNNQIKGKVKDLCDQEDIDIIHANDWVTVPGGIALAQHLEVPLVVTMHSTENERGFDGEHSSMISELEWKGGFEAEKVFATKEDTKNSLLFDLDLPGDKVVLADPYSHDWLETILNIYRQLNVKPRSVTE